MRRWTAPRSVPRSPSMRPSSTAWARCSTAAHSAPTSAPSSRCWRAAVLEVHDRQMPLMIALQRGDDSLDDLRDRRATEVVDRGHRYATRWLRKKIADGGFPDYDTDAVVTVALGSLLAYAAAEGDVQRPATRHRRRSLRRHLGRGLAPRRRHRRSRPRHLIPAPCVVRGSPAGACARRRIAHSESNSRRSQRTDPDSDCMS